MLVVIWKFVCTVEWLALKNSSVLCRISFLIFSDIWFIFSVAGSATMGFQRKSSTLPHNAGWVFWRSSWWCYNMETHSALLALCEGNPSLTGGFPWQRTNKSEPFPRCLPEQSVEQTVQLLAIWYVMALTWRHWNALWKSCFTAVIKQMKNIFCHQIFGF